MTVKRLPQQLVRFVSLQKSLSQKQRKVWLLSKQEETLRKRSEALTNRMRRLEKVYVDLPLPQEKKESIETRLLLDEIDRLRRLLSEQLDTLNQEDLRYSPLLNEKPTLEVNRDPVKTVKLLSSYRRKKLAQENILKETLAAQRDIRDSIEENRQLRSKKAISLSERSKYAQVGETFKAVYFLSDIPSYLNPYAFFRLLTSNLPLTLSLFVSPTESSELLKKARQRAALLEMRQRDRLGKGKTPDEQIEKNLEETRMFIAELVHEMEKGITYSLYLSLEAKSKEELDELHKELRNLTDTIELSFSRYIFNQHKALTAMLPRGNDPLRKDRIIQSSAASYLLPFICKQINDPDGIFLGVNAYHNSLVLLNPFTVRNSNMNILGVSGAGKSTTAKLVAMRLFARGSQIIIIDPEGEYSAFAKALGGEVISFSRDNGINPFTLSDTTEEDILDHIAVLKTFFKFFIPPEKYDGAVLDSMLIKLYKKPEPSLEKLLTLLKNSPMLDYLQVLNTGSLQGVFNAKRKLELSNDLIVFDISPLGDTEKRAPAMYLLTSLIWQLVNKVTPRKRMLFIDEAHKLLVDRDVAIFYREMVKQARKRNLGVVSITQDVEDFLDSEYGKAILTNSETKIILKQSFATLSRMENIFPMTPDEKQQLAMLRVGEAVVFRENEHLRLDMVVLPHEQETCV